MSTNFFDIYQPDVKLYEIDNNLATHVDEEGIEQQSTDETFAELAIYDKGTIEKRSATNPTQHQQLIHIYCTTKDLKNDDRVKFNDTWYRVELSQYANEHFFFKGYADV